jgi:hypothetical protein
VLFNPAARGVVCARGDPGTHIIGRGVWADADGLFASRGDDTYTHTNPDRQRMQPVVVRLPGRKRVHLLLRHLGVHAALSTLLRAAVFITNTNADADWRMCWRLFGRFHGDRQRDHPDGQHRARQRIGQRVPRRRSLV